MSVSTQTFLQTNMQRRSVKSNNDVLTSTFSLFPPQLNADKNKIKEAGIERQQRVCTEKAVARKVE